MKRFVGIKRRHLPTLAALLGVVLGLGISFCLSPDILGGALPIPTFTKGKVFSTLWQTFGKEALPLCFAIAAAFITKHPLFILIEVARRAFFLTFSSAYLATLHKPLIFLLYAVLHLSALLAHIAAGIAAVSYDRKTGLFPILYFVGLLFLLTVIRLLAFTLIL